MKRVVRRLGAALISLVLVVTIAFALTELAPGDTSTAQLGVSASAIARAHARQLRGSIGKRALQLAHLDLRASDGRAVMAVIAERLPRSLGLAMSSLVLAWLVSLALARARIGALLALAYAVPLPSLALGLLALGAPYGRGATLFAALCLQPLLVPRIHAQLTRALDEMGANDALRTLRMSGAAPSRITRAALRMHALRLVTLAALQLPALLSGVVLVEAIFGLPGLGLLAFDALASRDQALLVGLVMVTATITIACTLLVDLVAPRLDPRLDG